MSSDRSGTDRIWARMNHHRVCMLATRAGEAIRARPMAVHLAPAENAIYFLTDERRHKDEEIAAHPEVCLAFADDDGDDYVSVSGRAVVTDDRAKIKELWSLAAKAWWDSADDPHIRLIKVTPADAEYWDGENKIVASMKMAAAAMTGERPDLGENKKVRM
ncbi:MAG: pyridoxamine 5'-phosphate oxidase family protein [Alphaproteobacteria bacterium]